MGQKKETKLEDIARELKISVVSVSNALNDKRGVGEELRRKVKEKAEELGYHLPKAAPKKETKAYSIGVMIAERYVKEFPSFYMEVYRQIAQVPAKKGSLTLLEIVDAGKEELRYPSDFFSNMEIDGILFVGEMNRYFIREVRSRKKVPVVGVDFYDLDEEMDYVAADNLHGMQYATQKLINAGHRDIVFVGNPYATKSIMDRYMGYCKALKINGIEESAERVVHDRDEKRQNGVIEFELPEKMPTAFAVNCDKSAYYGDTLKVYVKNRKAYWDNYLGCILDGEQSALRLPEAGSAVLDIPVKKTENKEHEVLLFKRQDSCHEVTLMGFELGEGAEILTLPALPERKIEVYGDSVSAGEVSEAVDYVGKEDPEHNGEYSNSWYSYAWMTARKL